MFARIATLPISLKFLVGALLFSVLLIGWTFLSTLTHKPAKISSAHSEVRIENPTTEDPAVELQKLLDEGKSKPVWKIYLETYWPFAAGIGSILCLFLVAVKLVRRKPAEESSTEEESQSRPIFSMAEEDSGPRRWQGVNPSVVVPTLISVAAILIAIFSGPSQKDIIASVKSSVRANFENRFSDFQSQLDKKANDSSVGQLKSDLGKVKEDAGANTASLGLLSGRADASDQKITGIQKSVARARSDATVAREAAAAASKLAVKTSDDVQALSARQDSISRYFERKVQAVNDSLLAMNNRQQAISQLLEYLKK